jgi:hypothetical protein
MNKLIGFAIKNENKFAAVMVADPVPKSPWSARVS